MRGLTVRPGKPDSAEIRDVPEPPESDGPLLVRGDFELRDVDGSVINCRQRTVALCRCGRSAMKPFCDGTHKAGPGRERRKQNRQ